MSLGGKNVMQDDFMPKEKSDNLKYVLLREADACVLFLKPVKHAQDVEAVETNQIALVDRKKS